MTVLQRTTSYQFFKTATIFEFFTECCPLMVNSVYVNSMGSITALKHANNLVSHQVYYDNTCAGYYQDRNAVRLHVMADDSNQRQRTGTPPG